MDATVYLRLILALVLVVGLVLLAGWAARRFGLAPNAPAGRRGRRGRRLGIVEVTALDSRRRLVLVRRDDREHLLLLGPQRDLLIEAGIPAPPEDLPPGDGPDPAPPALPHRPDDPAPMPAPQEDAR
ncbi:flagellar biosynthetic protein FliO [Caenispirillum bisanense]|uniref:flagellar biosynthetic protein FliO n=1 Tax=Caenispirillum bisanense TaxID=414052 RepID=UPI0031D0CEBC